MTRGEQSHVLAELESLEGYSAVPQSYPLHTQSEYQRETSNKIWWSWIPCRSSCTHATSNAINLLSRIIDEESGFQLKVAIPHNINVIDCDSN